MQKPAELDSVLLRLGMPFQKLHKLWKRADSGDLNALLELGSLSASCNGLDVVLEWFRANKKRRPNPKALISKNKPQSQWERLKTSSGPSSPVSAGLPSLGKRR